MNLNGSIGRRVDDILYRATLDCFNKHKSGISDVEKIYQAADVPFTDAARRFYKKYSGIFMDLKIYEGIPGEFEIGWYQYNYSGFRECNLICDLFGDDIVHFNENVGRLKKLYIERNSFDDLSCSRIADLDAVPVGLIGYNFPAVVWIAKNDKLIVFRAYNNEMQIFDSFKDFLIAELDGLDLRATLENRNYSIPSDKFLSEQSNHEEFIEYYMIYMFWEYDLNCEGKIKEIREDRIIFEKMYWWYYCDNEGGCRNSGSTDNVEIYDIDTFLEIGAKVGDCVNFWLIPFCYKRLDGTEVVILRTYLGLCDRNFITETELGKND